MRFRSAIQRIVLAIFSQCPTLPRWTTIEGAIATLAQAISPHHVVDFGAMRTATIQAAISGVVTVDELPAFAVMFRPVPVVLIISTAMSTLLPIISVATFIVVVGER